jgi:hypothetical protein
MLRIFLVFPALLFVFIVLLTSCEKEEFESEPFSLEFSEDTIKFDTVFTTIGSATQVFIVYNTGEKDLKVTSIRIATGESSNFRLNVDGVPGKSFTDVEIKANDSIFIFVEVTVDPNNGTTPLIVTDSIIFNTNGLQQDVDLVAWGQDAYFHSAPKNSQIAPFFILDCNEIWNKDKPHVIYGYAIVDSACTLTVNAGTNVHLHPASGIIVATTGTLLVNGTIQENVTFQGDRLGADYKDVPGQWDRIWLSSLNLRTNIISPGSRNSSIKYAVIKNGTIGLLVDTAFNDDTSTVTLHLENTIIKNMALHALALRGSRVNSYNSVFANCGAQTTNILFGGKYNFYHCTFANYWNNSQRQEPAVSLNNYFDVNVRTLYSYFGNCIIHGNNENEFGIDSFPVSGQLNFTIDHTLLKVESSFPTSNPARYNAILKAYNGINDPLFTDIDNNIYELDSANSPAINAGNISITNLSPILQTDIKGFSRTSAPAPDMGAYERR